MVKALPAILYNNIVPVFIAIGLGYTLKRRLGIEIKSVSRTLFYALSPCLVFSSLVNSTVSGGEFWDIAVFEILITLGVALVAWGVARALRFDRAMESGFFEALMKLARKESPEEIMRNAAENRDKIDKRTFDVLKGRIHFDARTFELYLDGGGSFFVSGATQMLRYLTGLPWACSEIGPLGAWGVYLASLRQTDGPWYIALSWISTPLRYTVT